MIKERKIFNRGGSAGRKIVGSLRVKIIIVAIVFLIIIMLYQTYFESDTEETSSDDDKIPQISGSSTINIFKNIDNNTIQIFNPTISKDHNNRYLIAFERIGNNGTSNVWLSSSNGGETWNQEWVYDESLENLTNPQLKFTQQQHFILSYEHDGMTNISYSKNGHDWSSPEPGELFVEDKSVFYGDDYLFKANQTGLWYLNYDDIDQTNYIDGQSLPLQKSFTNASIIRINDYKFIIAHENSTDGSRSIILTTIFFKELEEPDTIYNWDLLIIFSILGLIFLSLIIQEISHD